MTTPTPEHGAQAAPHDNEIADGKNIAVVSYISLFGLIVAFALNTDRKNAFATYHIRQALGINLTAMLAIFVNIIPILGWIAYAIILIILFIGFFKGILNAINGRKRPVPVFGSKYEDWFKNL